MKTLEERKQMPVTETLNADCEHSRLGNLVEFLAVAPLDYPNQPIFVTVELPNGDVEKFFLMHEERLAKEVEK